MIVYTVDKGEYITMKESLRRQPKGKRNLYVNLTNRCTCACTFCLRSLKDMPQDQTLWLREEPSVEAVKTALDAAPWEYIREVVFCGFGEPTMRLDDLIELMRYIKRTHKFVHTRLNTNGLSDLAYGKDTSVLFAGGMLDTISISLNASNAERYLELTRSQFGLPSFEAMLTFAVRCQQYVPNVVLTIVDQVEGPDEIERCQKLCEARGLKLRIRPYETN